MCIVNAGLPLKPGMSRDGLLAVNTKIMLQVVEAVEKFLPDPQEQEFEQK